MVRGRTSTDYRGSVNLLLGIGLGQGVLEVLRCNRLKKLGYVREDCVSKVDVTRTVCGPCEDGLPAFGEMDL